MKGFGFTRKKFLSLTIQGQHRHLSAWLSDIYQTLAFLGFVQEYKRVCHWMGIEAPDPGQSRNTIDRLVYVSDAVHRHRTALGHAPKDYDLLDRVVTGDTIAPQLPHPNMAYQVALDGLRSLFNVGSIFRTCDAAGIDTIILGNCLGKECPQVRKTAMGAHKWLQEEQTADLAGTLTRKKADGYRIIAVETIAGSQACHHYAWPKKGVLLMGNEEYGISPHVLAVADDAIHIPMLGKKNALNVANALAIVLYQAVFFHLG